jgi:membrane peptidoglycan carboxypeptidase
MDARRPERPSEGPTGTPRDRRRRLLGLLAITSVVLGASALLGAFMIPRCEDRGCPALDELGAYRPPEPPRVYDREGDLIGQLPGERRLVVPLERIPRVLSEGYVAVEDRRVRRHDGVDERGFIRAAWANLRSGRVQEGASTITMQLVRNMFAPDLLRWNKFRRKLAEIALALEVERQLSKDEILELYLNQIYLGDGVYGVETASRHYFGKPVEELTDTEAALLVGLAKNPEGYQPWRHPEAARARVRTVVDVLSREGVLSPERSVGALQSELDLRDPSLAPDPGGEAYFIAAVRRQLRELFADPAERAGLRVYTGLDRAAQAAAVRSLREQIAAVEAGRYGPYRHEVPGDEPLERAQGSSPFLQGMVVAMEATTGLVTTLVGGRDYVHSEFDRAFMAHRQPGSAFKPIVYATALEAGARLHESVSTEPVRLAVAGADLWQPTDHVDGQALTLRDALVLSSNTVTVRVGMELGPQAVAEQARAMGIDTDLPLVPSLYLGAGEVVPAALVAAYATFGNGGRPVRPHLIEKIEDASGNLLFLEDPPALKPVMDPRTAFLVLDVLRDVTRRGTGWRAASPAIRSPVAGKTGTTDESKDAWFIGLTPAVVAGVWLGFDRPQTIVGGAEGGTLAAPVWASFMEVADRNAPAGADWPAPPGVVQVRFDPGSGFYLPGDCTAPDDVRMEWALEDGLPPRFCPEAPSQWFRPDRWLSGLGRWAAGLLRSDG